MKNIEVCEKCDFYHLYDGSFMDKNGDIIDRKKHYCKIDVSGVEFSNNSVKFKECDTSLEDYVKSDIPQRCPYKLEHLVIKNGDEK